MNPDDLPPDPAPMDGSDAFFSQVYDELRAIAHARMRGERRHTLQSTELVHEAYVRLRPADGGVGESYCFKGVDMPGAYSKPPTFRSTGGVPILDERTGDVIFTSNSADD